MGALTFVTGNETHPDTLEYNVTTGWQEFVYIFSTVSLAELEYGYTWLVPYEAYWAFEAFLLFLSFAGVVLGNMYFSVRPATAKAPTGNGNPDAQPAKKKDQGVPAKEALEQPVDEEEMPVNTEPLYKDVAGKAEAEIPHFKTSHLMVVLISDFLTKIGLGETSDSDSECDDVTDRTDPTGRSAKSTDANLVCRNKTDTRSQSLNHSRHSRTSFRTARSVRFEETPSPTATTTTKKRLDYLDNIKIALVVLVYLPQCLHLS